MTQQRASWEAWVALFVSLVAIGFTYLQLRNAEETTRLAAHQQLLSTSLTYDKHIASNPDLRPYFRDGKRVNKDDQLYNKVAATADMLLDIIDGNVEHSLRVAKLHDLQEWLNAFGRSFKNSPIMCEVFSAHRDEYSTELRDIASKSC